MSSTNVVSGVSGIKGMAAASLTDNEFQKFRDWLYQIAGISLAPSKKPLLSGRLQKRLRDLNLSTFEDYYRRVTTLGDPEAQIAIDLLTTNETWFFRESKHFDFLRDHVLPAVPLAQVFRVWSAASSTGEEPYSIAMTLAEVRGDAPWEVLASDLSTRVLAKAASGHYAMERTEHIPKAYLQKYCLRGVGQQNGTFLVHPEIRRHMRFEQINLNQNLPDTGSFDVIFLRNVMIYFEARTKEEIIARLTRKLKPGGFLFIGHSDSLMGTVHNLRPRRPAVLQAD